MYIKKIVVSALLLSNIGNVSANHASVNGGMISDNCEGGCSPCSKYLVTLKEPIKDDVTITENNWVGLKEEEEHTYDILDKYAGGTVLSLKVCKNSDANTQNNVEDILLSLPLVEYVEKDFDGAVKIPEHDVASKINKKDVAPWGLDRIDQASLPLSDSYLHDYSGDNVYVYVLDTGVYKQHNEFNNIADGKNFDDESKNPYDKDGHGTHCASVVGGEQYGVSPNVVIVPVKVLNDKGYGSWSNVIKGIQWSTTETESGAGNKRILSMSLGGSQNKALDKVLSTIDDAIIVVAAGNGYGDDACNYSPAGADANNMVTVGSIDSDDHVSEFSSEGKCVDIMAPGDEIIAAGIKNPSSTDIMSGTSMATPHVAGILAQIWQKMDSSSPEDVIQELYDIALPFSAIEPDRKDTTKLVANTPREDYDVVRDRSISTLVIDWDVEISGIMVDFSRAEFGPDISVLGDDVKITKADDKYACDDLKNSGNNMVVLIERGKCDFVDKVLNAQKAGYVGVVITNNKNTHFEMGDNGKGSKIDIPSIMIGKKNAKKN